MLSNDKLRPYIFIFLIFCVVSSKHIIIYNEEILVALSFFLFVIFVSQYFGNNIKESLDERSQAIKTELQNFLNLKQESLNELLKEHKKVFFLKKALQELGVFTNSELNKSNLGAEKSLNTVFSQQIQQKLKTLSYLKLNLQQKLQQVMAANLLNAVLVQFNKKKQGVQVSPAAIKRAISLLVLPK
jgi:F0F1-type ATP synthase membrane subunit b/b'